MVLRKATASHEGPAPVHHSGVCQSASAMRFQRHRQFG